MERLFSESKGMRQNPLITLLLCCLIAVSSACNQGGGGPRTGTNTSTPAPATPADGVRRVPVAELQALIEKNEAVVIDVRGEVEYKLGHIRGSRSLPLGLLSARAGELPRDKLIVAYCA
jgi:3-mercaptopyruvate sulfurtransferase SseA